MDPARPPTVKMRLQLAVVLVALLGAALATTSYEGHKVYRLTPSAAQLGQLKKFENVEGFDIWTRGRKADAPLDIMVSPRMQQKFSMFLTLNHIQNEVIIEDVQVVFDAEKLRQESAPKAPEGKITFTQYHTHDEINAYLDEMVATYPSLASVQTIGSSTEGRDLKVLKISRGGNNPVIWIDAGIHAREWIAPAMALYVINQLLEVPANSALLDGVDWHILPVVNPDGYQWTHTNARLWRKTRSRVASTTCPGVDANRNWDFHWNEIGASTNPCSEIFCGPEPFSEPENVAMRDYILANANDIALYLTFHSYGNYFLYPWGWTSALPDGWQAMDDLAHEADDAQQAAGGNPYEIGSSTNVLYEAAGASDDWALGVANIPLVYTVELPGGGPNGFDLPASQIQKTVREFFAAVVVFGNHVRG